MKPAIIWVCTTLLLAQFPVLGKNVAYIHGDIAADGTIPSGAAAPYDQMLLTDSGSKGCSQFKAMVEGEGYTISQHYDQNTTLNTAFLNSFDVLIFGLHQKIWSSSEKNALDAWLRNGGGIMMYSDSATGGYWREVGINNTVGQAAVNNILSIYGMEVTVDQAGGIRSYTSAANHPNPIVWDQAIFEGEGVSPVAIDPTGNATALIPLDNAYKVSGGDLSIDTRNITIPSPIWAVIGHAPVGEGHIIAIFDRQPMWNNGPGSDINEEDNKEILRRIVRYLARDYGNSSDWINMISTNKLELTYRQWHGGTGTPGIDYTARNTLFAVQHSTDLLSESWAANSNWVEHVSTVTESSETEITTVRILPDIGNAARFSRVAILPATNNPAPPSVIAINCGGSAFTGSDGASYQADTYYVGGHTDTFPGNPVANTNDDLLYNYARSSFSAYNIPIANGSYTVRLKFSETYFTAINKRVFDISLEGAPIINDLDLFATAPGIWVAYDLEFPATVTDGTLNITATSSINNSLLNAIVVSPN